MFTKTQIEILKIFVSKITDRFSIKQVSEILKNALKCDFWDVDEMANKIVAVLRHRSLKDNLKTESEKEISYFSWSRAADEVLSVYNQLV